MKTMKECLDKWFVAAILVVGVVFGVANALAADVETINMSGDGAVALKNAKNFQLFVDAYVNGTTRYVEQTLPIMLSGTNDPPLKGFGTNGIALTRTFEGWNAAGDRTNQPAFALLTLPSNWVEGSPITPVIHYAQTSTNGTGYISNVVWKLEYLWVTNGGKGTMTVTNTITNALPGIHWGSAVAAFTPITNATGKILDSVLFRYLRQGTNTADTCTNDVALLSFGVRLQVNAIGSATATTK